MYPNNKHLTRVSQQIDLTLDDLEQAVTDRNVIELKLKQSFEKLSTVMKALDRRWDSADHARFRRLHAKHAALQKALSKVQNICGEARQQFHDTRGDYDVARLTHMGHMIKNAADMDHLQRRQGALERTLNRFVDRVKSNVTTKADGQPFAVQDGSYDYIPYDIPRFLSLLIHLDSLLAEDPDFASDSERYRPVSFLEVGCGPGRNLLIARDSKLVNLGSLTGFDINPDQLAIGRQAFDLENELHFGDAMIFDYGGYDVVFSYRPFSDHEKQQKLEAHIAGSMRNGAYLVAPSSQDLSLCRELMATSVSPDIWKKVGG